MKVVFDTNVLISSTLWEGSSAQKLLFQCIKKGVLIHISPEILSEYQAILKRDFSYSDEEIALIVEKIMAFAILIKPETKISLIKEDPDDDKIIECAIDSLSEYLITYDKHLLVLKQHQNTKIIKPEEFMELLV